MVNKAWYLAVCAALVSAQQTPDLITALNSTASLSSLYGLVASSNLTTTLAGLSNVTILAPNNEAISAFVNSSGSAPSSSSIDAILTYHVLQGTYQSFAAGPQFNPTLLEPGMYANVTGGQRVQLNNGSATSGYKLVSNITTTTVNFTGGVIHVIDKVLTVPANYTANQQAFNLTAALGVARDLNASHIFDTGPELTVFMPTNDAWARIGSIIPTLNATELEYIVGYHIVNLTSAYSTDLANTTYKTVNGQNLTITKYNESAIFVNQARIVIPNILLANGVMHIIDNLINPDNQTATATNPAGQPAYSGATSVTSDSYTSGVPGPTSTIDTASLQLTATGGSSAAATAGHSSSSSGAAWMAKATGAVQAALAGGIAIALL